MSSTNFHWILSLSRGIIRSVRLYWLLITSQSMKRFERSMFPCFCKMVSNWHVKHPCSTLWISSGSTWTALRPRVVSFWVPFGSFWVPFWVHLGSFWVLLGPFGFLLGPFGFFWVLLGESTHRFMLRSYKISIGPYLPTFWIPEIWTSSLI